MPSTAEFLDFNKENNVYTCAAQFGTPIQNDTIGYTFAVDTSVGMIMTTTKGCGDNCTYYNSFDMTNSSSLKNLTAEYELTIPGGYSAKGKDVKDLACTLPNLICMSDISFFAITNGTGTNGNWTWLNVFGLAPTDYFTAPDYVESLYAKK